jgi:hypothetical protein
MFILAVNMEYNSVLTFQQHSLQPKIIVTEIEMSLIAITTTFLLKVAVVVMIIYVW